MKLPSQDSATGRGLKTALQAVITFIVGLAIVVWKVPGVPQAIFQYASANLVQVVTMIGLPMAVGTGLTSFVWNVVRKDVPNY